MKRSSFLKRFIAVCSIAAYPLSVAAKGANKNRVSKGLMVDAGKDRYDQSIHLFEGDTFYSKVSTQDTDGDIYVFESSRLVNGGPALHYHLAQDEWWYVLRGEFLIKVGDELYHAKEGDSVFGPRMIPHAFAKVNEGEGKLLMFFQPAGKMEAFFKAISGGAMEKMSEKEQDEFRLQHGTVRVGGPITHWKR